MPEVCEIVITAQYLLSKIKNCIIKNISVLSGRYTHQDLGGIDLFKNSKKLVVEDIDSKGKFIWFILRSDTDNSIIYLLNTFGLTGEWGFDKNNSSRIQFDIQDPKTKNTFKLYYSDARNFGTMSFTDNKKVLLSKLNKLGPDLLKSKYTFDDIHNKINKLIEKSAAKANTPIVKILMDQTTSGIGSGLGNYLAPEILYKAKIDPSRKINTLKKNEIKELYNSIKYVVKLCYYNNSVGYMENFGDYINNHKKYVDNGDLPDYHKDVDTGDDTFTFKVYRQKKDPSGNPVKIAKIINNRSTYWVPKVQK